MTSHSMTPLADQIPVQGITGLKPTTWLCVGGGFSREDIKAILLRQGHGFVGDALQSVPDLCRKILSVPSDQVLGGLARQEVLRMLIAEPRISAKLTELKRLKRQGSFFKRLDQTLQSARMAFAHVEEEQVYSERLEQKLGGNPVRDEIRALTQAYEAWLQGSGLWDPPLLLRAATERLREEWPAGISSPEEIVFFSVPAPESLERDFWEVLARHVPVRRADLSVYAVSLAASVPGDSDDPGARRWLWERWHTLDDAAEGLADRLAQVETWRDEVILIPDNSDVRRSLKRALESRGISQADPRDPTRLKWDEMLKWAVLPLEVVARGYERERVVAFLSRCLWQADTPTWIQEIHARGIRSGLKSYSGGVLSIAYSHLEELEISLGGRKTCAQISEGHLTWLRTFAGIDPERQWVVKFFEGIWTEFIRDTARLGLDTRRAPILYWWERFQARLSEAPAPVERLKPEDGVQVYRLHQAPLEKVARVWIFGMPSQWLSGEGAGDYWFSERDREVLSGEFAVRSGIQIRQERMAAIQAWIDHAGEVAILDAEYGYDGRERESLEIVLREISRGAGAPMPEVEDQGAHPRWIASFNAIRPTPPQTVKLPPLPPPAGKGLPEITATALDHYSRCSFQSLVYDRWKLRDVREPEPELWPDMKGNLLHQAVQLLLEARTPDGSFSITPREALDAAWKKKPPKGLIRSERIERYVRSRLVQVLESFCEKERDYFERAHARTISLDNERFRLEYPDFALLGTPDRIDETEQGIFVIDYKTGGGLPNGTEMLESGYRLQLPFYALAASRKLGKPAIGVQFVELTRKAGRGSGIFFKPYNGKEAGKLTNVRSNSKSLLSIDATEAWSRIEEQILSHAREYLNGKFEAKPKRREKECQNCRVSDLCGFRRLSDTAEAEAEVAADG